MECTKVNYPMQAGTPTDKCGENCPWRTTAKTTDLISRKAAIDELMQMVERHRHETFRGELLHYTGIKAMLEIQPAVDAVPVVHARWINYPECLGYDGAYTDEHIVCSACHSVWNIIDNETDGFDYCPACGAKMDGERRDDE